MPVVKYPRTMPTLPQIFGYWSVGGNAAIFPNAIGHALGWTEPFRFRCSWRAPLPELPFLNHRGKPIHPWDLAKGWLERAHLHEKSIGGPDSPDNVVALCCLCHRQMPYQLDRAAAVAWINGWHPDSINPFWQLATERAWGGENFRPFVGSGEFLLLRLQVDDIDRHARVQAARHARDEQKAA